MRRIETIGPATLYLGDCRDILPHLGRFDLMMTDPPYGQKLNVNVRTRASISGGRNKSNGARNYAADKAYPPMLGDAEAFNPQHLLSRSENIIIWGAHKFHDRLPGGGSFLVWDKVPNGKLRCQGDGEVAWINRDQPLRIFRHLWDGICIAGGYETRIERIGGAQVARVHPTQKPVDLMAWSISQAKLSGGVVLDPYMGAGSTGIAAINLGFDFVGIEMEEQYFDHACRRIELALSRRANASIRSVALGSDS